MTHQWDPEQIIEPPMALQLIREQFPELKPKHIRLLGAGWDNTAFIIDEELNFSLSTKTDCSSSLRS